MSSTNRISLFVNILKFDSFAVAVVLIAKGTIKHKRKNKINKCPVCGKCKRIKPFSEDYPMLVSKYSSMNSIPFNKITADYQKEYLWECEIHGTYKQRLSSMIRAINSKYQGCPYCANKTLNRKNSLKTLYPFLYKELSTIDNYIVSDEKDFSTHSQRKLWWICPNCEKKYSMSVSERIDYFKR